MKGMLLGPTIRSLLPMQDSECACPAPCCAMLRISKAPAAMAARVFRNGTIRPVWPTNACETHRWAWQATYLRVGQYRKVRRPGRCARELLTALSMTAQKALVLATGRYGVLKAHRGAGVAALACVDGQAPSVSRHVSGKGFVVPQFLHLHTQGSL